jgi:hypothetical protein
MIVLGCFFTPLFVLARTWLLLRKARPALSRFARSVNRKLIQPFLRKRLIFCRDVLGSRVSINLRVRHIFGIVLTIILYVVVVSVENNRFKSALRD